MATPLSRVLFPLKTLAAVPSRAKISMSTGAESPSSHPQWVLFDAHAFTGSPSHMKATAARETTANHQTIEVSFCPSSPPLPSTLFVCCPDLENPNTGFTIPPIICAVEDLLLIRVATPIEAEGPKDYASALDNWNYFVYRARGDLIFYHYNEGHLLR